MPSGRSHWRVIPPYLALTVAVGIVASLASPVVASASSTRPAAVAPAKQEIPDFASTVSSGNSYLGPKSATERVRVPPGERPRPVEAALSHSYGDTSMVAPPTGYSTPAVVDQSDPIPFNAVSCATSTLCVAVDADGNVLTSTNPTGGWTAWSSADLDDSFGGGLSGVSCTSVGGTLCVATDLYGNVFWSTNPAGGSSDWFHKNVDGTDAIFAVSCPSVLFCVATDDRGYELLSQNPAGVAWSIGQMQAASGTAYGSVSCPSTALCVAVSLAGTIVYNTTPSTNLTTWNTAFSSTTVQFGSVSCATTTLCVATDNSGGVYTSSSPGLLHGRQPRWMGAIR